MKALTVPDLIELAKDHNVTTEKLKELITYNTQVAMQDAVRSFNRAFAKLQEALPIIEKNESITFKDGRTGTYAPNDEIQEIVGPICRQFGFTLSFATTYPAPGMVKVTGELAHKDGHSKFSEYEARVDMSGGKTDAQGRGSVMSYGHRYTTVDLLNLIQRGTDSDGSVDVQAEDTTPKPEGYRDFENSLRSAAMVGMVDLGHVWTSATPQLRAAVPAILWSDLKQVAMVRDAHVI